MKILRILLPLLFTFLSAKTQTIDSLEYNRGGGITGIISSYRYNKKSVVFAEGRVNLHYTYFKKVKKTDWKNIRLWTNRLLNDNTIYYSPANYYTSITIFYGENTKKYMWPTNADDLPNSLQELIKLLQLYQ